MDADIKREHKNPKRRQREARKMVAQKGIGTKSQQALQMQREEKKIEKKLISKEQKEAEKQRREDHQQLGADRSVEGEQGAPVARCKDEHAAQHREEDPAVAEIEQHPAERDE